MSIDARIVTVGIAIAVAGAARVSRFMRDPGGTAIAGLIADVAG